MNYGLNIPSSGALDFLSLGAMVHRLDPGIIPFRKATECQIHVSGGEFNVSANLSDCFGLKTGIVTAMVDYPIGDLAPLFRTFDDEDSGCAGADIASNAATAQTPASVSSDVTSADFGCEKHDGHRLKSYP